MELAGVLGAEFQQRELVPARRNGEGDAVQLNVGQEGDHDLASELSELAFDLCYEAAEHGRLLLLDLHPEAQVEALDDGAAAHAEEIAERVRPVEHQREDVQVAVAGRHDDGLGVVLPERLHAFLAQLRGLEVQAVGGLRHGRLVAADDLVHAALQQVHDLVDPAVVLLLRHLAHAAAAATADMVVEARAVFAAQDGVGIDFEAAGAQRVVGGEQLQQASGVEHGAVWPEVAGAVLLHTPGQEHARKRFRGDADPGVGLAVLQEDVVAGLVLLDEVVFQQQGVGLGLHDGVLHVRYPADQQARFHAEPGGVHEILVYPLVEVLRLAYVNYSPFVIVVAIDAGTVRQ